MIDIDFIRSSCLNFAHVTEDLPFGPDTLAFRVGGKIFCLLGLEGDPILCNLKCDPERVEELRENHSFIIPGYHMNKQHWNSIILDQVDDVRLIKELIGHAYELVFKSLPKKVKAELV